MRPKPTHTGSASRDPLERPKCQGCETKLALSEERVEIEGKIYHLRCDPTKKVENVRVQAAGVNSNQTGYVM